jgi:GrpB-like predicted nucleotidyltransferase (UPF0157 family)
VPYQKQPGEFQEYGPLAPEVAQYVIDVIQMHIPNVTVENIGSTAVPGCSGRAVIDLMISTRTNRLSQSSLGWMHLASDGFSASMPCRKSGLRGQGLLIINIVSSDSTFLFNPLTIRVW